MSCSIKTKSIDYLKEKGAISTGREIVDPYLFDKLNKELTDIAFNKYGVGNNKIKLFKTDNRQNRRLDGSFTNKFVFEANDRLFDILEEAVKDFSDKNEIIELTDYFYNNKTKELRPKNQKGIFYKSQKEYLEELFDNKTSTDVKTILDKISNSEDVMAPIAKYLSEKVKIDVNIELSDNLEDSSSRSMLGKFDPLANRIYINKNGLFKQGNANSTILHEVLHFLTYNQLNEKDDTKTKALQKMLEHARKKIDGDFYALTDVDEFAVALFTDAKFIKALKDVPPVTKKSGFANLYSQLLDYILGLLNIEKSDSLYEQAFALTTNIIEENTGNQQEMLDSYEEFKRRSEKIYGDRGGFDLGNIVGEEEGSKKKDEATESVFDSNPDFNVNEPLENEKAIPEYIELKDVKDKLEHNIKLINKSLEINMKKYKELYDIYTYKKDTNRADYMEKTRKEFEALKKEVNDYQGNYRIRGVVAFVQRMTGQMQYIERKLNEVDYEDAKSVYYTVKNYDAALKAFGVIDEIKKTIASIREDKDQDIVTSTELEKIESLVLNAEAKHGYLKERVHKMMLSHMKHFLNDIKYFSELETKHRERLRKEYSNNEIAEPFKKWAGRMMNGRDEEKIKADLKDAIDYLLEDPSFDIAMTNTWLHSAINTSSTMIQIYEQLFTELKNKRIDLEREKDREFKALFEEATKAMGTNSITKLYKNILEYDKTGKQYLLGDYKVGLLEVNKKKYELRNKLKETLKEHGLRSSEYEAVRKELDDLNTENFQEVDNKIIPKDKWKNDLSKLSDIEKKLLNFFKDITEEASKNTFRQRSLVNTFVPGAKFYELPKITKSDSERIWTGTYKGSIEDKWKDLTTVRSDDVGYKKVDVDGANNPLYHIPVHYRDSYDNPMKPDQQSLDLMTIYRLEYKNGIMYKLRSEVEMEMNLLKDIAGSKKFYNTKGTTKQRDKRTGQLLTKEGRDSQTYKMMQNMLESRLYDIMYKTGNKIGKIEAHKAVGFINGVTAFLGMSFNIASGTANVVNANAQLFLESFIKGQFIKASGIRKANRIYGNNLKDTLLDNKRPIKESFVNQINELFDVKGLLNLSDANFMISDLLKAGLSSQALQVFQNSGENWIQSVTTMAVLDGIKVMDENNNYINKEGKVVEEEKNAASLLDMLEKDDKGMVRVSDKVVYTTHSKMSTWKNGGKEKINMLIRKKLEDTIGNYTEDAQPEVNRHALTKLFYMYRKYLIPMGVARLRGAQYIHIPKEEMDDSQKRYSYALQEYEEGTYVSLARYIYQSLKDQQYNLLSKANWNKLSDYEKHNVKRAVTELVMSFAIIPLVLAAMGAAADGDDELVYFTMYQLRRLDSELSQYRDPTELFKIMRSPIPSSRILETAMSTFKQVFNPFDDQSAFDVYETGQWEGQNKLKIRLGKQIPVIKDYLRNYQDLFEYQNRTWGAGI